MMDVIQLNMVPTEAIMLNKASMDTIVLNKQPLEMIGLNQAGRDTINLPIILVGGLVFVMEGGGPAFISEDGAHLFTIN